MASSELKDMKFWVGDPGKLGRISQAKLDELFYQSIWNDFPDRSDGEVEYLVGLLHDQRLDPNCNVGGSLQRKRQEYASPIGAMATKRGLPIAYIGTADNVSSRLPGPLGEAERKAKLHLDGMVQKRWHWFGMRALAPELVVMFEPDSFDSSRVNVLDVLAHLSLKNRKSSQPVSSYPWHGEKAWPEMLGSWGLVRDQQAGTEPILAFGEDVPSVQQERWTTDSVSSVISNIMRKAGVRGAITRANENLIN